MKYTDYIPLLLLVLSACSNPNKTIITFEDIQDSSNRAIPTIIEENITFYDTNHKIISTDKFNRLLAEGLYLSEPIQKLDGSEAVHLISIKEHTKKLESQPLPDFELLSLSGEQYTKQRLLGKVTVLSFWSTTSRVSTRDILDLNLLAKEFSSNENCIWIAAALDSPSNLSRFLRGQDWNLKFVAGQEALALKLGILTYPTHLIIDQQGTISKAIVRHTESSELVLQAFKKLLK
jgi:peroxiredoxin